MSAPFLQSIHKAQNVIQKDEENGYFTGAGVALITPMNEDGSVNYEKLRELLEFHVANKTDAIIICGTTGRETSTLSDEEHLECIRLPVK